MSTLRSRILELGADSGDLDSIVDAGASRIAERVNNEGLSEQLSFLEEKVGLSEDEIIQAVKAELS